MSDVECTEKLHHQHDEKICGKCKQSKPVSAFNRRSKLSNALKSYCKKCSSKYNSKSFCNKVSNHIYRENNLEKEKARVSKWKVNNREKVNLYQRTANHKRRSYIREIKEGFTVAQINSLFTSQHEKCVLCGKSIKDKFHIDHIMPIALGGGNTIKNIQLLCPPCNLHKGAKHPSRVSPADCSHQLDLVGTKNSKGIKDVASVPTWTTYFQESFENW